jgi:hypothetical protein
MPLQATSGAASYDAFGGGVPVVPNYIEDVFSTWLYAGTGANQTITNGIDESGKGAMTWIKCRTDATSHALYDTERGAGRFLTPNATSAQSTSGSSRGLSSFNSTGFSLDDDSFSGRTNQSGQNYVSWTFRKQPKFFDVVTYTGNGSGNRIITTSLGSPIGCVFIKRTDSTSNWATAHRKDGSAVATGFQLNTTAAAAYPSSSNDTFDATGGFNAGFIADSSGDGVNFNGATYVAYVFAHNAGGFGLTGTDNVISCGSFTTDASSVATVNLGYEPQWVMFKCTSTTDNWRIVDNMRGFADAGSSSDARLFPNLSSQEFFSDTANPTATGFVTQGDLQASQTYIYIAIRRGPMKVPTSGTSVFSPVAYTGDGSSTRDLTFGFPVDMFLVNYRGVSAAKYLRDRLRGGTVYLNTVSTDAEAASYTVKFDSNTGIDDIPPAWDNANGFTYVDYGFRRAPSFFDEVCYTGTGVARTVTHNLAAVPELMIVKQRSSAGEDWLTYSSATGNTKYLYINGIASAQVDSRMWNDTTPTSSVFTVGTYGGVNSSGVTLVAYLFATCAGVSKCFNYTGNGSSQTINCGFTGGARWILIKRTDSTGDWYVWDSARGIVSGNDPHLSLNTTAAEVTSDDTIDTDSTGFVVNQLSATNVNVSSATYIGLAIA